MVENEGIQRYVAHVILWVGIAVVAFPVYLAFVASTQDNALIANGQMSLLPGGHFLETYYRTIFVGTSGTTREPVGMGGSTNTVLHLLAAAYEGEVPFTMKDIDRLSRRVPVLCKVAPSVPDVHLEDVHRAGGVMAILGELDRAKLITNTLPTVHSATLKDALERWDVVRTRSDSVRNFYSAAPGGVPTQVAFSQNRRFEEVDTDRATGCIRDAEHAGKNRSINWSVSCLTVPRIEVTA